MRNRVCIAAFAAVLGVAGLTAPSASSAAARAGAPSPVSALAPFEQDGSVVLRWTNPRSLDRDIVRISRGPDAPATVHDGRSIKLGSPRASKAELGRLPAGRQFSVSVWTQRGSRLSRKETTSFTTKPVEGRRTSELAGGVVDTAGNPLRNATVLAYDFTTFARLFRSRTDAAGHFRLLVPGGHYQMLVIGTHALGGSSDRTGYRFAMRRVTVRPSNVDSGIHFALGTAAATHRFGYRLPRQCAYGDIGTDRRRARLSGDRRRRPGRRAGSSHLCANQQVRALRGEGPDAGRGRAVLLRIWFRVAMCDDVGRSPHWEGHYGTDDESRFGC